MHRLLNVMFAAGLTATLAAGGQTATVPPPAQRPNAQKPQRPLRDAAAAQPAAGTAAIAGTLVTADTGKPIRRADVRLISRDPRVVCSAVTDLQGRFTFGDLPAGAFTLSATQPGYLDVTYGQKKPGAGGLGTPIRLADRQRLDTITLRMPRGGVLTGTVLDESGDPAFGTQVRALRYVMRTGERVLEPAGAARTDDRGIYRIPALPPGDYIVSATPRESAIAAADQPRANAAADAGVAGALAAATARRQAAIAARPARALAPPPPDPAAPPPDGYAPVFYPGTTMASGAATIALDVSEERVSVDLQLQLVPMARLEGTVSGSSGPLPPGIQIQLVDSDATQPGKSVRTAGVSADGRFSFSALAPGRYSLMARAVVTGAGTPARPPRAQAKAAAAPAAAKRAARSGADVQMLWAVSDVTIDGHNLSNVTMSLQPGMSVAGRVTFQGAKPPADLTRLRVGLEPAGRSSASDLAGMQPGAVSSDGQFTIAGVVPGTYRVRLAGQAGAGWTLASAVVNGRDALDFPLEVRPGEDVRTAVLTLTDHPTDLSGTLQNSSGQPTDEYYVIVFSADASYWTPQSRRIQATRPGTDGRYAFRNLPPGNYRVTALIDVEPGAWFDPALLRQLTGASIAISLGDGEKKMQDLRVSK